jgi:RNA polymerase sigma-70 factor (ECF subfamily)
VAAPQEIPAVKEEDRFARLYREYYRRVHGLCRQLLGSSALADDATQETFLRAHGAFSRYDAGQPFAGWIMSIATNHCIDVVRRRSHERRLFGAEDVETAAADLDRGDALRDVLTAERAREVGAAVMRLPERYRVPLVLAYYRDLSYDEIAATLGLTRTHVGALICRAKQALRRDLAGTRQSP